MARKLKLLTACAVALLATVCVIYLRHPSAFMLSLGITCGTCAYHLLMRLLVGGIVHGMCRNRMDYRRAWFRPRTWEHDLYCRLHMRRWSRRVPTYAPQTFSRAQHTWEEIAMASCQAEIVHEIIVLLSFVPLLFAIPFGALPVFVLTSLAAALIDTYFVLVQRYQRPALVRLAAREQRRTQATAP